LFAGCFPHLQKKYKAKSVEWLRETMDEDEIHFLEKEEVLDAETRNRVLALLYGKKLKKKQITLQQIWRTINEQVFRPVIRPVEMFLKFRKLGMSLKTILKNYPLYETRISELNEMIAERDKKIVELKLSHAEELHRDKKVA
jgi:hypothetical protein